MPKVLTDTELADFREKLAEAATGLFAARGREGFTMRELAAELGVSPMTPYRYFRDKDAILAAVRARAFDQFALALEEAFAAPGNSLDKSIAVCDAYVAFAFEKPSSYRLMFDLTQADACDYPDLMRAMSRARATMTDYVKALVRDGVFKGDPDVIGHVFWAALHGMVMLQLAGQLDPTCDFETIRRSAFMALGEGFRAKH
jgi:AcrR family transcriptional regulator